MDEKVVPQAPKEEPKREVTGAVIIKKKSAFDKFKNSFIVSDMSAVADNIVNEVVIPQLQNFIMDMVNDGLSMLFTGNKAAPRRRSVGTPTTIISGVQRVDYSGASRRNVYQNRPVETQRQQFDIDGLIFEDKASAALVRNMIVDNIEIYKSVSINDLYDFAQMDRSTMPPPYTAEHYGWAADAIPYISVQMTRDGWWLKLPPAVLLP